MSEEDPGAGNAEPNEEPEGELYLAAALFCERTLIEADGVLSLIRVVDQINVPAEPLPGFEGQIPDEMPTAQLSMRLVLMFKSSGPPSPHTLAFRIESPSGETKPVGDSGPVSSPSSPGGFNILVDLALEAKHAGTYWIDVLLDDQQLTRIPLTVAYTVPDLPAVNPQTESLA